MRATPVLFACLLLAACNNDLADSRCDIAKAATVAYDGSGQPYFAGQALMIGSCGPCHESIVNPVGPNAYEPRNGAPIDLNWDLDYRAVASDQQLTGVHTTFSNRGDIWGQVSGGSMPPTHTRASSIDPAAAVTTRGFHFADGSALPTVRTPEGREILRNWLACRAPVVQGTPDTPGPDPAFGNIVECEAGSCVLEPTWNDGPRSLFPGLVVAHCMGGGCHSDDMPTSNLHLTPDDPHGAYTQLVGTVSRSPGCDSTAFIPGCEPMTSLIRIVPGNADCSLVVAKLRWHYADGTTMVCGPTMPLSSREPLNSEVFVDPLIEWINAGAPE